MNISDAMDAHTNLNTFAAIVAILEGGCVYGPTEGSAGRTASRIIKLCQEEQHRQLKAIDKAAGRKS